MKENKIPQKILLEKEELRQEAGDKFRQYIGAGFGLVAGLAWNDAIKSSIEYLFPLEKNSLTAKFAYAVLMTLVVVVIGLSLAKLFKKKDK